VLVCFDHLFYILLYTLLISHDTDAILLLEHSFYLAQQKDPKPVFSALEKYNAFNIRAKVVTALEEVFKQYTKASQKEKVDMVLLVITQNRMGIGELNICFNILFIRNSILDTPK
jgi:hypothetical protein